MTDILVYIFIRNTLPTVHEYFLGKNQPEIGIAWIVAFSAAVLAGWLEHRRRQDTAAQLRKAVFVSLSGLVVISILLTVVGVGFFDVRPWRAMRKDAPPRVSLRSISSAVLTGWLSSSRSDELGGMS